MIAARSDFRIEVGKACRKLGIDDELPPRINLRSISKVVELMLMHMMTLVQFNANYKNLDPDFQAIRQK